MVRSVVSKVMWVGRATVFLVGLAVILALLFGVARTALAGTGVGATFNLGKVNSVNALSKLVGTNSKAMLRIDNNGTGPALNLETQPGKPAMTVNAASGKALNLNADRLDGLDATEIGVNGWQRVEHFSASNSDSPKIAGADCPSGKILVGHGFDIPGGKRGSSPDAQTDVVIDTVLPYSTGVIVEAFEEEPTNAEWGLAAWAICATAP